MPTVQLAHALNSNNFPNADDAARMAILEWAWSLDLDCDPVICADQALRDIAHIEGSSAVAFFKTYLAQVSQRARAPRRRGGRAARLAAIGPTARAA